MNEELESYNSHIHSYIPIYRLMVNIVSGLITIQRQDKNNYPYWRNDLLVTLSSNRAGVFRNIEDTQDIIHTVIPNGLSKTSFRYKPLSLGVHTLIMSAVLLRPAVVHVLAVNFIDDTDINPLVIGVGSYIEMTTTIGKSSRKPLRLRSIR